MIIHTLQFHQLMDGLQNDFTWLQRDSRSIEKKATLNIVQLRLYVLLVALVLKILLLLPSGATTRTFEILKQDKIVVPPCTAHVKTKSAYCAGRGTTIVDFKKVAS